MNWHNLSTEQVYREIKSSPGGLAAGDAAKRLKEAGSNELQEKRKKSAAGILLSQFRDVMILVLSE